MLHTYIIIFAGGLQAPAFGIYSLRTPVIYCYSCQSFERGMSLFGAVSQPSTGVGFSFGTPSSTTTGFGAFGVSQQGNTANKPLFGTTSFGTNTAASFGAATTTTGSVFSFGAKTTASSSLGIFEDYFFSHYYFSHYYAGKRASTNVTLNFSHIFALFS